MSIPENPLIHKVKWINALDNVSVKEGTAFIINISLYGKAYLKLTGNGSIEFTNLPTISKSLVISITVETNGFTLDLPDDIMWENGTIPIINNGTTQVLIEFCNIGSAIKKTGFLVAENIGLPS